MATFVRKTAAIPALCMFLFMGASSADAHMYFSFPSDHNPGTATVDVYTAFALNPPVADESGYEAVSYDITGRLVSSSGSVAVTSFPYSNSRTGRTYSAAELGAMTDEQIASTIDSRKSSVSVTGSGTSVFLTEAVYSMFEPYGDITFELDFMCYSKAFLNLTDDSASVTAYQTSGLEIVPLSDLASATPVSSLSVKILLDGQPIEGVDLNLGYEGCPFNPDLNGEVSAMRLGTSDANGVVEFVLPSRMGKTYLFAMALDNTSTATRFSGTMASVSFEMTEGEEEIDVADVVLKENSNNAGIGFLVMTNAYMNDYLRENLNLVWANDLVEVPTGSTNYISGQRRQLPGTGTGANIEIPMDITGSGVDGFIGFEHLVALTPEMIGSRNFENMVSFINSELTASPQKFMEAEDGSVFYCPYSAYDLLDQFGLTINAKFSDGAIKEASENFMLGALYDTGSFNDGRIYILFGTLYKDANPDGKIYWTDLTPVFDPSGSTKIPLVSDGVQDDTISITYWLAEKGSDSSSDCNAVGLPILALALFGLTALKKRLR